MDEHHTAPRWIADLDRMVLSERQSDGSYRDAYSMVPLDENS